VSDFIDELEHQIEMETGFFPVFLGPMVAVVRFAQAAREHVQYLEADPDAFWMEFTAMTQALAALRSVVEGTKQ
jgi:hypothetical protein